MDKKKIVIVIVVFLLLGTMVFSFANPRTEDEQLEGNDPPTEEQGGNQDDGQDDEQQGDSQDDNQDDEQQGDSQDDNQQGNDTPVDGGDDSVEQTTDYLSLAQQAVEKAEQSLAQGDVTAANEAIQDVIDNANEDVSDLQNRIENVQNIIDFETLLTQLENKTNGTTNKDELDVVRNDKETKTTTTTLDNLVENLANVETNADKITNLTNRYNTVLAKLNDTTPPSVSGIKNGEYTKGPVSLTITDDASFTATLNGENYVTGTAKTEDGEYTLIVIDDSFNEIVVTFTIDTTAPVFTGIQNGHQYKEVTLGLIEENIEEVVIYNRDLDKYYDFFEGMVLTDEGTYTAYARDKAGNLSGIYGNGIVYFTIDNTKPVVTNMTQVYEEKEGGRIKVTIETSEEIFGDLLGSSKWRKVDGKNEYYNYYYGTQEVTINFQDRAGNEGTYTFTVDMTAPIFTKLGIAKNGNTGSKYVTNDDSIRVLVYFKEQLAVLPKVKINGVEYNTYYAIQSSNPDVNDYAYYLDLPITAELNLPQGIINFEVYGYADEYGNEGEILTNDDITYSQYDYVIYDSNKSEIKVDNLNDLGYTNNGNVTITDDNSFNVIVKVNGKEKHSYSGDKYKRADLSFLGEGQYEIIVTDAAGNVSTITFNLDKTLPVLSASNILVSGDVNEQAVFYATNGDKIKVYVRFNEELKHNPTFTLINNGKEYTVADEDVVVRSFDDGQYQYSILFEITKDIDMTDGEITMLVSNIEDLAGNKYQDITEPINGHRVYLDRTLKYNTLGIAKNGNTGSKYVTNGDSIRVLVYFKEQLAVLPKVKINGVEYDTHYATQSSNPAENRYAYHLDLPITAELNLPQGKINFEVYGYEDKAGNKGEILTNEDITYEQYDFVIYDTTLAARVYSTVDFDGTGITPKVDGTRKTYYVNNGKSFVFRMQFTEQLLENPILNVGNKKVELELVEKFVINEGKYIYQGTVEINEEDNFADGSLPLILSNVKDLAGNETTDMNILNQTITSNDRTVVIDNTPSTAKPLYILARDDASYRLSISDGEYLRVEANFNEELSKKPTLTVGSQSIEFDRCNFNSDETRYVCVADIKIDNSIARLVEGENIPFTVTNIYDLAGNPSEFNNDDVTDYYRDDELVYSNVKFENPFVSMSFHNSTNYKLNEENNNTDLSVTEAKVGDTVRVFVRFNQDIDIENFKPIIVIGGVAKELNLSNIYNDGTKDYGADITITKEMNLKLNEEIPFVIKNIVLKNGNNLPNLNQDDITSTNLSGVIYIGE